MPIPDLQSIMRQLLELGAHGKEHPLSSAREEAREPLQSAPKRIAIKCFWLIVTIL